MISQSIFRYLILCGLISGFGFLFSCEVIPPSGNSGGKIEVILSSGNAEETIKVIHPSVNAGGKIEVYLDALAKKLDPKVADAISSIEGTPRRLLALRGYIRNRSLLKSNWSWNNQEIAQYKQSAEYRAALEEVDKVKNKFAELNPGYSIDVNTEVRTLDLQIASWNREKSVSAAAQELFTAVEKELSNPIYKDVPDQTSLDQFQGFLQNQKISVSPTVATPGLSQHGQLRAFDFRIKKGNQIIATTLSSTIDSVWDGQGWTQKLKAAVSAASQKFRGPLANPREPWHYTYDP